MVIGVIGRVSVIEVEHLAKSYGPITALVDVSFAVEQGEIFGILGPNGAGKTTTVECIQGLRAPDAGRIRVLGLDPERRKRQLRRRVGAQLQESALPDRITVREALDLFSSLSGGDADWRSRANCSSRCGCCRGPAPLPASWGQG
jgi:ABC-2 type transport system ATP-binding protein